LVPKQHSTGGKERLGSITKQGNRYLRWLLVAGAMAVIRYARQHGTKRAWLTRIMDRRPAKVAAVALANKIARMAWAIIGAVHTWPKTRKCVSRICCDTQHGSPLTKDLLFWYLETGCSWNVMGSL
jgi:hypothetical protein